MKKIISIMLFVALFVGVGVAFAGIDDGDKIHTKLSSNGMASDPIRIYQIVRFPAWGNSKLSASAGDVVLWDLVSDDGVTINYSHHLGVTASSDAVAGVVIGTIQTADSAGTVTTDVGKRNWGYIQVYGINERVKVDKSNIAAGEGLRASQHSGRASATDGEATTHGGASLGFAYDASASTEASIEVFIKCM